jgi:hypothetical protein
MRTPRPTLALIFVALLGAASARAGQLVQDPSFELGPSNPYWSCSQYYWCNTYNTCGSNNHNAIPIISTAQPRTGAYGAHLETDYDTSVPCRYLRNQVSQTFTIPSNVTSATLNFWVAAANSEAPGLPNPDKLYVELYDAISGVKYATLAVLNGWSTPAFQYSSFTVLGLAQWKGAQVRVLFRTAPNTNEDPEWWYLDDVTVNTTP